MIPLFPPSIDGPPTPEMASKLNVVKFCVIAVYICALGRLFADDPFGALNDLFGGLFGTFLLKEDPHLSRCYNCLHDTPVGALGPGGLPCLMPYMFLAGMNGIFGALRTYTLLRKYKTLFPCFDALNCIFPMLLLLSSVAQLISVYYCWQVYKMMQLQAFGDGLRAGMFEHPEGPGSVGDHPPILAELGPGSGPGPHRGSSFQPFQGQPFRLSGEAVEVPRAEVEGFASYRLWRRAPAEQVQHAQEKPPPVP